MPLDCKVKMKNAIIINKPMKRKAYKQQHFNADDVANNDNHCDVLTIKETPQHILSNRLFEESGQSNLLEPPAFASRTTR